jgi:hypothetical protein
MAANPQAGLWTLLVGEVSRAYKRNPLLAQCRAPIKKANKQAETGDIS